MRRGFSLITAILFMVVVASLGALALSFASLSTKQTSDVYLREQAELLVQSATEYALLAISAHTINAANGCLNYINATYIPDGVTTLFDINISIHYLGVNLPSGCLLPDGTTTTATTSNIDTNDSNVTVIIDTIVTDNSISTEPIRLHRRTLQKP
jgi:type II secretory pathway pseudopilin PulG